MDAETVMQEVHVLRLTNEDVDRIIADPKEFASDLIRLFPRPNGHDAAMSARAQKPRKSKQAKAKTSNWASNGYAGNTSRTKKKPADAGKSFRCRKGCNRLFKKDGYRIRHEAKCTGGDDVEIGSYHPAAE